MEHLSCLLPLEIWMDVFRLLNRCSLLALSCVDRSLREFVFSTEEFWSSVRLTIDAREVTMDSLERIAPFVTKMTLDNKHLRGLDIELAIIGKLPRVFENVKSVTYFCAPIRERELSVLCAVGRHAPNSTCVLLEACWFPVPYAPDPGSRGFLPDWEYLESIEIGIGAVNADVSTPDEHSITFFASAVKWNVLTALRLDMRNAYFAYCHVAENLSALSESGLSSISSLQILDFCFPKAVKDTELIGFVGLGTLKELSLHDGLERMVTRRFLDALSASKSLEKLSLFGCYGATQDDMLHFFQSAKFSLKHLRLIWPTLAFTDSVLYVIAETQTDLEYFCMSKNICRMSPGGIDAVKALPKLKTFKML